MERRKMYVEVMASFRADGLLLPREIILEDGQHYEIDRVSDIRQSASMKVGGQGDRYTIIVSGQPTYLFFERNESKSGNNIGKWFVESKVNTSC